MLMSFHDWLVWESVLGDKIVALAQQGLANHQIIDKLADEGIACSRASIVYHLGKRRSELPPEIVQRRVVRSQKSDSSKIEQIYDMYYSDKKKTGEIAAAMGLTKRSIDRILSNPYKYPPPLKYARAEDPAPRYRTGSRGKRSHAPENIADPDYRPAYNPDAIKSIPKKRVCSKRPG